VQLSNCADTSINIDKLLGQGVNTLFRIDRLYEEGNPDKKNAIIGSMFPEKLTFDGFLLRTARVNEVARLIYRMDAGFSENKKGQKSDFSLLSCQVTPSGFELLSLNV
jgi:site-specific DNA recombinase